MAAIAPGGDDWAARIAAAQSCVDAADSGTLLPGSAIEKACVRTRPGLAPPAFAAPTFAGWEHGSDLRAKLAETKGIDFDTLRWPAGVRTDVPLIVLTATDNFVGAPKGRELWAQWQSMHDEVARISPHGVNCVIANSTHSMMLSRPDAVVAAVSSVVAAARGGRAVTADCDQLNRAPQF